MINFMSRRFLPLILTISVILNLGLAAKTLFPDLFSKPGDAETTAAVSRVIDGDTFDLADNRRIRLLGIDAPEYPKGCLSQQAKDRLEKLILGKQAAIKNPAPDNFQRLLASVSVDGLDVGRVMVSEGYAATAGGDDPGLLSAQDQAQAAGFTASSDCPL